VLAELAPGVPAPALRQARATGLLQQSDAAQADVSEQAIVEFQQPVDVVANSALTPDPQHVSADCPQPNRPQSAASKIGRGHAGFMQGHRHISIFGLVKAAKLR
jgi:hypothetical protein